MIQIFRQEELCNLVLFRKMISQHVSDLVCAALVILSVNNDNSHSILHMTIASCPQS